jgi:hypothetical protein
MVKIKEFVEKKLINFKKFISEELEKVNVDAEDKKEFISALDSYSKDTTIFMQAMVYLSRYKDDLNIAVSMFLLKYNIKIEEIKDNIDYDKLKKYLNMFIEIVTENNQD